MFLKNRFIKIPSDIIPCISAHLTDCSVLDNSLRFDRANHYLLYFFFHKNIPKDAKQYNKLLTDKTKYYKDYDFTYHNQRDLAGILKTMKTKYKQLKSRTYDITFDKTKYDIYEKMMIVLGGKFSYMTIMRKMFYRYPKME